jgi:hypothetical protein
VGRRPIGTQNPWARDYWRNRLISKVNFRFGALLQVLPVVRPVRGF